MNRSVEYTIIARKTSSEDVDQCTVFRLPSELLATEKGQLIINPIYKVISRSREGLHLWRKRENEKWELECLMMIKAMPLQILLPLHIMEDVRNRRISASMRRLLLRGIILEVPKYFV